jgi:very-short-patch-repair endonuclease
MEKDQKLAVRKSTKQDLVLSRTLRNAASWAERKLWRVLSVQAKTNDLHFRRQHPIHPFVIDFACLSSRLLIELDGDSHDSTQAYDTSREERLKSLGYKIMRFSNQSVYENVDGVVEAIIEAAKGRQNRSEGNG